MARLILIDGTPAEIAEVYARVPALSSAGNGSAASPKATGSVSAWTPGTAKAFRGSLYGAMSDLFEELVRIGKLPGKEALKICKYKSMHELSGTLSGITRAARSATGNAFVFAISTGYTLNDSVYEIAPALRAALGLKP